MKQRNVPTCFCFLLYFLATSLASPCHRYCTCRWRGGKEIAECTGKGLTKIPEGIGTGVQVLDISRNSLHSLPDRAFSDAGLSNLQKLSIQECRLVRVDEATFSDLTNLVDLDLGHNFLMDVPSEAISMCQALMRLSLSNNPIRRLEDRAFPGLPNLSILEMNHCNLSTISPRAFLGLSSLSHLRIDGNKLTTLSGSALAHVPSLQIIEIQSNLWNCDCNLRELQTWFVNNSISSGPSAMCATPPRLKGTPLETLKDEDLACLPNITSPAVNATLMTYMGQNTKLLCLVSSIPASEIRWLRQGRVITNNTIERGGQRFMVEDFGREDKRSILTIKNTELESKGIYVCDAENRAGKVSANITLFVSSSPPPSDYVTASQIAWILLFIIILAVTVSSGVYYFAFHYSRRREYEENKEIILKDAERGKGGGKALTVKNNSIVKTSTSSSNVDPEKAKMEEVTMTQQFVPYQNIVNEYESALMDASLKNPPDVVNVRRRGSENHKGATANSSNSARSSLEMYSSSNCVPNSKMAAASTEKVSEYKETDIDCEVVPLMSYPQPPSLMAPSLLEELSERLSAIFPSSSSSSSNNQNSSSTFENGAAMSNSASHPPPAARCATLDARSNRNRHSAVVPPVPVRKNNSLRRTLSQERVPPNGGHPPAPPPVPIREEIHEHAFQNQQSYLRKNSAAGDESSSANKSAIARMRSAVPVLPPLPLHRQRTRESPDEGYADEGEEVCE